MHENSSIESDLSLSLRSPDLVDPRLSTVLPSPFSRNQDGLGASALIVQELDLNHHRRANDTSNPQLFQSLDSEDRTSEQDRFAERFTEGSTEGLPDLIPTQSSRGHRAGDRHGNTLVGDRQRNTMVGRKGRDRLLGKAGNDWLWGNQGRDYLMGGRGRDRLIGGRGNDLLVSSVGQDIYRGGRGKDTIRFRLKHGTHRLKATSIVKGFQPGTDTLDLGNIRFEELHLTSLPGQRKERTLLSHQPTGKYLLILNNVSPDRITIDAFQGMLSNPNPVSKDASLLTSPVPSAPRTVDTTPINPTEPLSIRAEITPEPVTAIPSPDPVKPFPSPAPVPPIPSLVPAVPIPSPVPAVPIPSPVPAVPIPSPVPAVPIPSPVPVVPTPSPDPVPHIPSPVPAVPTPSPVPVVPTPNPIPIPVVPSPSPVPVVPNPSPAPVPPSPSPVPVVPNPSPAPVTPSPTPSPVLVPPSPTPTFTAPLPEQSQYTVIRGTNGDDRPIEGTVGQDWIEGLEGGDRLEGKEGDDFLFGGKGKDIYITGSGNDVIFIRQGDGDNRGDNTNVVKDFEDGTDLIQLQGIRSSDLNMIAGVGKQEQDTLVRNYATKQVLVVLKRISPADVTLDDFILDPAMEALPPTREWSSDTRYISPFVTKLQGFDLSDEAKVKGRGGATVTIGTQRIYIGYRQVSSTNQDPIILSFDDENPNNNWQRTDYEESDADGRGYGLFWSGTDLYAVFSIDGTQGTPDQDFRRASADATTSWLKSYGQGGGAKVAIIGRIDPATGELLDSAYISAVLKDGKTNTLVVTDLSINANGNLLVRSDSRFYPRNVDGSPMVNVGDTPAPFDYTVELTPDLKQVISTSAVGVQ